jgi:hypothetical protein
MGTVYPNGNTTGIAAPILVGDLPSDTIAANNASKIYDGIESDPNGATQTVSLGVSPIPSSDITYSGDPNAGTQTVTPGVSSSYSPTTQSSPGSFTFIPGTLTIGKATLTLSGTEVYNGTKTLAGSHLTATGVDGQTFSVSGTGTGDLSTANVQTNQPLANVTNLTLGTSANGGLAANYNGLSTAGSSVSVTPATLTATANASMTYGSSVPTLSGTVTGFVNGQTLASDGGTASWTTSATSTSNAGSYAITGSVTLGSPYSGDYTINGFQLTGSNVTTIVGTVTIAPAILGLSTTATKTFDGKAGIVLTSDNSSLTGVVAGQTAGLKVDIPATLSSSSIGSDLGGTFSLDSGDLTGNSAFFSALSAGDYILPTTFTGGRVFSLSSGPVIPAYQASVSEASLAENSANAGTGREAASLPSFPLPPVANFVSPLGGGLNMGDLTDDSSTIFGLNTESSAVPSKSSDQTIYTIDSTYVFPAETQSLNDESAEKTAEPSGSNGEKSSSEGRSRMSDTLDSITLAGSRASSYSLQVPTFNDSVGGVFESQKAR